jgi:hypothetical protein
MGEGSMSTKLIRDLRAALEEERWSFGAACEALELDPKATRAELKTTAAGQALLEEAERRRPRSGTNTTPKRTLRGMPDDIHAAQKDHAAGKGMDWSAWVLKVTEAARRKGQ